MFDDLKVKLAQGQLDAYNARDIDLFCTFYHPKIKCYRFGQTTPFCEGLECFKQIYGKMFENTPDLNCTLKSRIILENNIIDEEWVVPRNTHTVAIYSFQDGLISEVTFLS